MAEVGQLLEDTVQFEGETEVDFVNAVNEANFAWTTNMVGFTFLSNSDCR